MSHLPESYSIVCHVIVPKRTSGEQLLPLPLGIIFCDISLLAKELLTFSSDDLSDCFPTIEGTNYRAASNVLGKVFQVDQFKQFKAYQELVNKCNKFGAAVPSKVLTANRSLVIGDLSACDWAVEAHMNLLFSTGSFPTEHLILNRHPLPRSKVLQGVVVNDRFIISIGELRDPVGTDLQLGFYSATERHILRRV